MDMFKIWETCHLAGRGQMNRPKNPVEDPGIIRRAGTGLEGSWGLVPLLLTEFPGHQIHHGLMGGLIVEEHLVDLFGYRHFDINAP